MFAAITSGRPSQGTRRNAHNCRSPWWFRQNGAGARNSEDNKNGKRQQGTVRDLSEGAAFEYPTSRTLNLASLTRDGTSGTRAARQANAYGLDSGSLSKTKHYPPQINARKASSIWTAKDPARKATHMRAILQTSEGRRRTEAAE